MKSALLLVAAWLGAACGGYVDDPLDPGRFYNEVSSGKAVWLVVFDVVGEGAVHEKARKVAVEAVGGWLKVGWFDVSSGLEARMIADVNGAASYPFVKAFNGRQSFEVPAAKVDSVLNIKSVIEKWLPDRLPHPTFSVLRQTLPDYSEGINTDCLVTAPETLTTPSLALLRAVAMNFWGDLTMSIQYTTATEISIQCGEEDDVKVPLVYEDILEQLGGYVPRKGVNRDAALQKKREEAKDPEKLAETLVPRLQTMQKFNELVAEDRMYFDAIFVLDSTSKKFSSHRDAALEVAKNGGGSVSKKVPFAFWWVDSSVESKTLVSGGLAARKKAPTMVIIISAKARSTPDGPMVATRAVLPYTGPFNPSAIISYLETQLMAGEGVVPLALEHVTGFSGDSNPELQVEPPSPLSLSQDADELLAERKEKKKAAKKKSKKQVEKEAKKVEEVKEEMAAKKAAREQRIKEKKEKEAAEREAKKKEREEERRKKQEEAKKMTKEEKKKKREEAKKKEELDMKQKKKEELKKKREKERERKKKRDQARKAKKEEAAKKAKEEEEELEAETEANAGGPPEPVDLSKYSPEELKAYMRKKEKEKRKIDKKFREAHAKYEREKRAEEKRAKEEAEKEAKRRMEELKKEAEEKRLAQEKEYADEDGEFIAVDEL